MPARSSSAAGQAALPFLINWLSEIESGIAQ
jgi:hypothetical protein